MVFKLQVRHSKAAVYCSVLEFTSDEGVIVMPQWMMNQLGLFRGDEVDLYNVMLQKGTEVTLRPHTYRFVEQYPNPDEILALYLNKYATLTRGTTIQVKIDNTVWYFDITALRPTRAVLILDVDLRLSFDEPLDIKDYEAKMLQAKEARQVENRYQSHAAHFLQDDLEKTLYNDDMCNGNNTPAIEDNNSQYDNIFAEGSDEEDNKSLKEKLGTSGYSLKKNAINHVVAAPLAASVLKSPPSTNSRNTPISPSVTSPKTGTTTKEEEELKRKRDEAVRAQRAALFAGRGGLGAKQTKSQPVADVKILGTNVEQKGTVNIEKKSTEIKDLTTTVEGDWIIYKDQNGRLVKREEVKKSFAMTGIGNSIKK
eukprot:UN04349